MTLTRLALSVAAGLFVTACSQPPAPTTPPGGSGDQQNGGAQPPPSSVEQPAQPPGPDNADWARILELEAEAKALVKTTGCSSGDQCRTAPVGSRACGGPRYYLVYCSRTTDSAALFRKLAEVESAERAYNTKYQIGSTCEFRMPPTVGLTAGACQSLPR